MLLTCKEKIRKKIKTDFSPLVFAKYLRQRSGFKEVNDWALNLPHTYIVGFTFANYIVFAHMPLPAKIALRSLQ